MKTVRTIFLRGAFRSVLMVVFKEAAAGRESRKNHRWSRAWKLFVLLPRMLFARTILPVAAALQGGNLKRGSNLSSEGQLLRLLEDNRTSTARRRRRVLPRHDMERRFFFFFRALVTSVPSSVEFTRVFFVDTAGVVFLCCGDCVSCARGCVF